MFNQILNHWWQSTLFAVLVALRVNAKLRAERLLRAAYGVIVLGGAVILGVTGAPAGRAQSANPDATVPAFEVASVKPNKSGLRGASLTSSHSGTLTARNVSLKQLVSEAYRMQTYQIAGPGWIDSEKFDVVAKADGKLSYEQMMPMLRTLLLDRFHMAVHTESRDSPRYAVVIAKGGLKIRKSEGDCPAVPEDQHPCGGFNIRKAGLLTGYKVSMAQFTHALGFVVGRSVVDQTGLEGLFDIDVRWTGDEFSQESEGPTVASDTSGPSLFSALQQQLGLKLEAQRGRVETLVIDRAARTPVEN